LSKTAHHAKTNTDIFAMRMATVEDFEYRAKLINDNLDAAIAQIKKIREAAKKAGCEEVLKLLDEKSVPGGHDFEVFHQAMAS
jgi:hypothetical protein